jgi:hypothetical protein
VPGSAGSEAIEDALLEHVALERRLSPGLLLHLAARFDWRDTQGRAARRDPEQHAVLLDRLAAEDFFQAFRTYAEAPEGRLEAIMLAPYDRAEELLGSSGIGPEQRADLRGMFDRFLSHGIFLIGRLDGATLALLREAVEGPPLLGDPRQPASPPTASAPPVAAAPQSVATLSRAARWRVRLVTLGSFFYKSGSIPAGGRDTALPAATALPLLKDPNVAWVDMVSEPDGIRVDWAPVMRMRRAIKDLRVGYNDEQPTQVFPLPEFDAPIGFLAPPEIKTIVMRIRTIDGVWSDVRRYPVRKEDR